MKKKIAVIIPTWNSAEFIQPLLTSLKKQHLYGIDLLLVISDNASTDQTPDIVRQLYPDAVIIQNKTNLGLAEGCNIGFRRAVSLGANPLIVLNADTIADSRLLENLLQASQRHPDSLISPKIYFAPGHEFYPKRYQSKERGRVIWYAGGKMDWLNILGSNRGVDEVDHGQYNQELKTDFATGCCFLIPAPVFKKTGGFDPGLYLYYEDTDLSTRAQKAGYGIWYAPRAKLWHVNAGSSGSGSGLHDYFTTRNRLILGFRWSSLRTKFALFRESLFLLLASGRYWQRRGVLDFYLGRRGPGSFHPKKSSSLSHLQGLPLKTA